MATDLDQILQLTSQLVRMNTVTDQKYDERHIRDIIEILKDKIGFPYVCVVEGRRNPSIIATSENYPNEIRLLIDGHTDTVPGGDPGAWSADPWSGLTTECPEQRVYGRGAIDVKGLIAGTLSAVKRIGMNNLSGLALVLASGEESGMDGVNESLDYISNSRIPPPQAVLVLEPTGGNGIYAHKGNVTIKIKFTGESSHSAYPNEGLNAIRWGNKFLHRMNYLYEVLTHTKHPAFESSKNLGSPTLEITLAQGGTAWNVIPEEYTITLNFRPLPVDIEGQPPMVWLTQELQKISREVIQYASETTNKALGIGINVPIEIPAFFSPKESRLMYAVLDAYSSEAATVAYATHASRYFEWWSRLHQGSRLRHIPQIVVAGPGDINENRAHKADEYVTGDILTKTTYGVEKIIRLFCPAKI